MRAIVLLGLLSMVLFGTPTPSAAGGLDRALASTCTAGEDYGDTNGIALDAQGNIYLAALIDDAHALGAIEIQKLAPRGSVVATWTTAGARPGQVRHPVGIAVAPRGTVYVTNPATNQILQVSATGTVLAVWGTTGAAPGQFDDPAGVAVDRWGDVYVADKGNSRIQKFSAAGRLLAVWGRKHPLTQRGQFARPAGIAVDAQGKIYVADEDNRIVVLSPRGKTLRAWGSKGDAPGAFRHPAGIALDTQGHIYVADKLNSRIQVFSSTGAPVAVWSIGSELQQWAFPTGIAIDPMGDLYVSEGWCSIALQTFSHSGRPLTRQSVG